MNKNIKYNIFLDNGMFFESVYFSKKVEIEIIRRRLIAEGFPRNIVVQRSK